MRTKLLVLLAMVFSLAFVGTAMGQDNATEDAYGGVLGEEVSNQDDSGSPAAAEEEDSAAAPVAVQEADSLPFTGLELGLVALAGFGLVGLGLVMRHSTRHRTE